jgi:hypothetical protein
MIVLALLAFPGFTLLAAGLWFVSFLRYRRLLIAKGLYAVPKADEFFAVGPFGVYERVAKLRSKLDEKARTGELGAEAERLAVQEIRARYLAALAIFIGPVLAVAVPIIGPFLAVAVGHSTDFVAASLLSGIGWLVVVVCTMLNVRAARTGRALVIRANILGLLGAIMGFSIALLVLWSWSS